MIHLHGLKTCDTCRKALKSLKENGMEADLRDLRSDPATREEVSLWHGLFGTALLNTRSTTWRGLSAEERAEDPVTLMLTHPALIKRPVVQVGQDLHLGWTAQTRAALGLLT